MKTWIMTLPFACVVGVAMAQGVENGGSDANSGATAASQLASAQVTPVKPRSTAARRTGARTLPKGDVRHCLDLETKAGVIRCSESGKNRKR